MTDEMILGIIAEAAQVFGERAREVSLHLGETMLTKPIALGLRRTLGRVTAKSLRRGWRSRGGVWRIATSQ